VRSLPEGMGWRSLKGMQQFCHTCGGDLPAGSGESPFCPHCGAPQLTLSLDYQSPETGGDPLPGTIGPASTGAMPPPRPQQVDWQMAIRCALAVAGIAAVLNVIAARVEVLSPVNMLWIMSASLITLGLYQRRRPAAWMDVAVGARIGLVAGLCLALGLAISAAGLGLVERFGLHSMGSFDAQMAEQMVQLQQKMQQQSGAPVPADALRWINSPEFRGGLMICFAAITGLFLLVVSTVGGAFAGLLRMRRKSVV
jgi:hypothetical protein